MKVRPSVKKMCDKCKIIKRNGIIKKYLIWYLYLLWSG